METLKKTLILPPLVRLLYSGGHVKLDTDSCNTQIDCILRQKRLDDTRNSIRYWSRLVTDFMKRECLAIACSILLL